MKRDVSLYLLMATVAPIGTIQAAAQAIESGSTGTSAAQLELTFWQSVADSQDRGQYEAYLAQYPNGIFAALAKLKIAAILKQDGNAVPPPIAQPTAAQVPAPAVVPPPTLMVPVAIPEPSPTIAIAIQAPVAAPVPAASPSPITLPPAKVDLPAIRASAPIVTAPTVNPPNAALAIAAPPAAVVSAPSASPIPIAAAPAPANPAPVVKLAATPVEPAAAVEVKPVAQKLASLSEAKAPAPTAPAKAATPPLTAALAARQSSAAAAAPKSSSEASSSGKPVVSSLLSAITSPFGSAPPAGALLKAEKKFRKDWQPAVRINPGEVVQFTFDAADGVLNITGYFASNSLWGGVNTGGGTPPSFTRTNGILAVLRSSKKGTAGLWVSSQGAPERSWWGTQLPTTQQLLTNTMGLEPGSLLAPFALLNDKTFLVNSGSGNLARKQVVTVKTAPDADRMQFATRFEDGGSRTITLARDDDKLRWRQDETGEGGIAEYDRENATIWLTYPTIRMGLATAGPDSLTLTSARILNHADLNEAATADFYQLAPAAKGTPITAGEANQILSAGPARLQALQSARSELWGTFGKLAGGTWHFGNYVQKVEWQVPGMTLLRKSWQDDAVTGLPISISTMTLDEATGKIGVETKTSNGVERGVIDKGVFGETVMKLPDRTLFYTDAGPGAVKVRGEDVNGKPISDVTIERVTDAMLAQYKEKSRLAEQARQQQAAQAALAQQQAAEQERASQAAAKAQGGGNGGFLGFLGKAAQVYSIANNDTAYQAALVNTLNNEVPGLGTATQGAANVIAGNPVDTSAVTGMGTGASSAGTGGSMGGGGSYPTKGNLALGLCPGFNESNYRTYALSGGPNTQVKTFCGQAFEYYTMYKRAIAQGYSEADANRTYKAHSDTVKVLEDFVNGGR